VKPQEFLSQCAQGTARVAAAIAGVLIPGSQRRPRSHLHQHLERLAAEIVEVARSVEADLEALPQTSAVADLARRCGDCRRRAHEAASAQRLGADALQAAISQLHEDHRRVVDLRSDVDVVLAASRSGKPVSRAVCYANTSKPGRSRFATTGLLTRPSTLG
jgi:hypothetical protein